ncbi:SDR family oxidoreductase [Lutibaculum baratangense]|uniref:Nucleoside-diphosphate-sugar epimerase n=1 Tax=Lutibaculum baratangense AMV1 TaxID=631454 RepID=V4TIZ4_9HYPH|nr:SDR family oxidoreductase [Lutibaculum baratangense]ESR25893.1 Nucleoside-diphosphate-sugar epimerase [Lutibaculum baratangense AMV1]
MNRLFVFGLGYSATTLARRLLAGGWRVGGTVRSEEKAAALKDEGVEAVVFDGGRDGSAVAAEAMAGASHLLTSISPGEEGDPVLLTHRDAIAAQAETLRWIGYLSTIGVYGDAGGAWIDEETSPEPPNARTKRRVEAEAQWLALGRAIGVPTAVFRIAGIYGPGRNQLRQLKEGTAKRLVKPGQVFNRIHVDDIASAVAASMARPAQGRVYNLADDLPMPPQDVVTFAAGLLGVEPPPEVPFETAELSPMARSFYASSKRVSNRRIKEELGVELRYPTYREGLTALAAAGEGA